MKRWVWLGATWFGVFLFSPGSAVGQGGGDPYPHGPLPEGLGCADCHSTQGWSPLDPNRSFDHQEVTGFALAGRHAEAACSLCHQDLRFSALDVPPEDCGSCHLDVHQGTLSTDCTSCHTPEGFSVVSGIRIHQTTALPLEGAHLQLACESCHATDRGGAYSPLPSDCMACHQEDFEAPKVLDHVALGFPEDCLSCHTPFSWNDVADFDHVAFSGGYELQGVHGELPCSGCHLPGGGLRFPTPAGPQDCYSCHQADYQREHGGEGYPTTCSMCHSQTSWEGADDDHAVLSNGFVLEGAHQALACTGCHVPGGTASIFHPNGPQDCVACHQADYQREHAGSGYPLECLTCHTVASWDAAEFNHDGAFFPIYSGPHQGRWNDCFVCHTDPTNLGTFTCLSCHEHGKTQTDADHSEVRDYVYESGQCYSCHPTGREGG